jgi:hypothetical protein
VTPPKLGWSLGSFHNVKVTVAVVVAADNQDATASFFDVTIAVTIVEPEPSTVMPKTMTVTTIKNDIELIKIYYKHQVCVLS